MQTLKVIALLFLTFHVNATNYFVSNTGNDTNSGLNLANAFLTMQYASDQVSAGDTVFVEDGVYVGFDHRNVSGLATSPIVFKGLGNNVLINQSGPIRDDGINIENADFIVIDGFIVNDMIGNGNGIRLVLSDNCVVRNCSCDNNAERGIFTGFTDDILIEYNVSTNAIDEHGIYVSNSSDRPIIRFNECYGNSKIGIHMNGDLSAGGDGIISDAQVYGNILHDNNQAAGINMDGVVNAEVYNNLIYNNHFAQGIALFQQDGATCSYGAKIYNNTIIVPSDGRWGILVQDACNVDTEIYNNIIINQHAWRGCIAAEDVTGLISDFNIVNDKMSASGDGSTIPLSEWQALGLDLNSQLASSLTDIFQDHANGDYNLAIGSQALDTGTNLTNGIVVDDILGTSRPQGSEYDLGAYEQIQNTVDLTCIETMLPTNANGETSIFISIKIQEINNQASQGTISFVFPKDDKMDISYDATATNLGPFSNLDNSDWVYDNSNPGFHIWNSEVSILANSSSIMAFEGIYNPLNTTGTVPFTVTIFQGSGGDANVSNNIDSETLLFYGGN